MMAIQFFLILLLSHNSFEYSSAAVPSHGFENIERDVDGSYRPRDFDHYSDSDHNVEFDHEAILGSVKEAVEYTKLSPEESKRRLSLLLSKMDLNGDLHIDRSELKRWVLNSFKTLSHEETEERLLEADDNRDGVISWNEYLQDAFGVDTEEEIGQDETGDSGLLVREEKAMWKEADFDGDGVLDLREFEVYINPEEHSIMHPYLLNQTMREKDKNKDGMIDFNEYVGERGQWETASQQDKEWLVSEKDKFDNDLDINKDGILDAVEIHKWVIPDNSEIADEEVDHLFAAADDNHDDLLSYEEILDHHEVFVGSSIPDRSGDIIGEHFDDEL